MGRYNFTSPGAAAGRSIEDFLVQQAMQQRQAILDEQAKREAEAQIRQRDDQIAAQRAQAEEVAGLRREQHTALEDQRDYQRAATFYDTATPGVIDPETAERQRRHGFGSMVRETGPQQGAQIGEAEEGVPLYDVTPGILETSGGSRWQQARAAEQARAEQAQAAQAAAAERATADRASREAMAGEANATRQLIAGMGAGNRQETTALRNQLLHGQITAQDDKRAEAQATEQRNVEARARASQDVMDLIGQLSEVGPDGKSRRLKGAASGLFGARIPFLRDIPGTQTATSDAALQRLRGRAVTDLLSELKTQSRTGATGLGALSAPELKLLENTATMLSGSLSDEAAAEELQRLYDLAERAGRGPTGAAPGRGNVTIRSITPVP